MTLLDLEPNVVYEITEDFDGPCTGIPCYVKFSSISENTQQGIFWWADDNTEREWGGGNAFGALSSYRFKGITKLDKALA